MEVEQEFSPELQVEFVAETVYSFIDRSGLFPQVFFVVEADFFWHWVR